MFGEYTTRIRVNFGLPTAHHPGTLKTEVDTADP
jgi:hypothetical protein